MIKSVPLSKTEDFRKALAALNKKQARYGLPRTSARETGRHAEDVQFVVHQKGDRPEQDSVRTAKVLFVDYEVDNLGMVRNDEGYRYVGTRSKDKNGVSVFCCEEKYREKVAEATDLCDHCGTVRNRKRYHVFAKDDGTIVRVGSVCCKEYFGLDASAALDMYVKTVTVWGDKSPASFDPETDEVFSWNDIYPHVKNFTKGFSEWGDHVIEYGVAPSKEDFSAEIEEIKKTWRGEAMGNAFMAARFGRPNDSFASNCADLMDYDFVSRNRLKLAFAAVHFGTVRLREEQARKAAREQREKQELEWAASQRGVEQPRHRKGEAVEFEGTAARVSAGKGDSPECCVVVDCGGVFYQFFSKSKAAAGLMAGDHVKAKGVFDWESRGGRFICQNVNRIRLIGKEEA